MSTEWEIVQGNELLRMLGDAISDLSLALKLEACDKCTPERRKLGETSRVRLMEFFRYIIGLGSGDVPLGCDAFVQRVFQLVSVNPRLWALPGPQEFLRLLEEDRREELLIELPKLRKVLFLCELRS